MAAASPPPALWPPTAMRAGIDAECGRVGVHPLQGGVAVVDRGRERVLGSQPVLGRDDDRIEVAGDLGGEAVLHVDGADDETAAVDVEKRRPGQRARLRWVHRRGPVPGRRGWGPHDR